MSGTQGHAQNGCGDFVYKVEGGYEKNANDSCRCGAA